MPEAMPQILFTHAELEFKKLHDTTRRPLHSARLGLQVMLKRGTHCNINTEYDYYFLY